MAMLLDGSPSTIEDLNAWDSDLQNVALSENLDLTAKVQLAAAAVQQTVETMLQRAHPSRGVIGHGTPTLRHIAVTPQLKLWHTCLTLRLIYQDVYYSRLNDRYKAKMKLYGDEEVRALDDLQATGLGVVFDPIPQALAPNIALVASSDTGGVMYIGVTLVNDRGEEGLMSIPVEADTMDGQAASIRIIALADNAVGWHLYAGVSPDALKRQNSEMLDPTDAMILAPSRLSSGQEPGHGQCANRLYPVPKRILRG